MSAATSDLDLLKLRISAAGALFTDSDFSGIDLSNNASYLVGNLDGLGTNVSGALATALDASGGIVSVDSLTNGTFDSVFGSVSIVGGSASIGGGGFASFVSGAISIGDTSGAAAWIKSDGSAGFFNKVGWGNDSGLDINPEYYLSPDGQVYSAGLILVDGATNPITIGLSSGSLAHISATDGSVGFDGGTISSDGAGTLFVTQLSTSLSAANYIMDSAGALYYPNATGVPLTDSSGNLYSNLTTGQVLVSGGTGNPVTGATGTIPISGTKSATGTATTTFTVTIGQTMANNTYEVMTEGLNALSAAVHYVTNKTTTTFDVVYIAGLTGAVAFDWAVFP